MCTSLREEILFLMHICRGRDIPYGRCIYQGGEDIELIRKLCFVCFSLCLFSCIVSCLCFGHTYFLMLLCFIECMFGWAFVLLCDHWCMIKLLSCFTSYLLDHNLLVTLYLSFYCLLYVEGLICFVQVFQVTSIYVTSASQLLIILKGRNFKHF